MKESTYEFGQVSSAYESYEWDSTWIELANQPDLKRVLYIGDSISRDIRPRANKLANKELLFDSFATSKAVDNPFFKEEIHLFSMQQGHREAILFNNGLHGWHLDDKTQYARYYEQLVCYLKERFPQTPLCPVLTTHVTDAQRNERVLARNHEVQKIAEKYNLSVIDLYTPSFQAVDLILDGVHFKDEGNKLLAEVLVNAVKKII